MKLTKANQSDIIRSRIKSGQPTKPLKHLLILWQIGINYIYKRVIRFDMKILVPEWPILDTSSPIYDCLKFTNKMWANLVIDTLYQLFRPHTMRFSHESTCCPGRCRDNHVHTRVDLGQCQICDLWTVCWPGDSRRLVRVIFDLVDMRPGKLKWHLTCC